MLALANARGRHMTRFIDPANVLPLAGLGSALAAALLAVSGHTGYAMAAMVTCGLCDLFDGAVAKHLKRTAEAGVFGRRLDSLVDVSAFGFSPAIVLYTIGLRTPAEIVLLFLFLSAAVWRLAYFDTAGLITKGKYRYFTGLPVTYNALIIPLASLTGVFSPANLRAANITAAIFLTVAMVSPVKVRKPGGLWYAAALIVGLVLIAFFIANADRFTI